jgi:hypothetical protein
MERIENAMPASRYELFTGHKSKRNLYLYKKLGYCEFRREKVSENLSLVFLEKFTNPDQEFNSGVGRR